jgi:hypothetical protein
MLLNQKGLVSMDQDAFKFHCRQELFYLVFNTCKCKSIRSEVLWWHKHFHTRAYLYASPITSSRLNKNEVDFQFITS